jgi:hypothetical protein
MNLLQPSGRYSKPIPLLDVLAGSLHGKLQLEIQDER